mmetsp:Transcript_125115/g.348153  ORF Transcript_125115/g.348153 Transcript_125115/m.348153 type:complete len:293 (+) Transcript_125115:595-1473(+)
MKRSLRARRTASNSPSTSSISRRATSASREAACTFSDTPCSCSTAFKFGLRRFSSTRKRSNSVRYSSSSILAAGPAEAALFSSGSVEKSTAMAPEAAAAGAGSCCCVGALAGWVGSTARSCRASRPPRSRGTSTSSSTLCRRMSARELPSTCSCEPSSPNCFSRAITFCRFSFASRRRPCSAWSRSRSTATASRARAWWPFSSSSRPSVPCASSSSLRWSSCTSACSFGSNCPELRLAISCSVCSSIAISARLLRSLRASSSFRTWASSCSRRHSHSIFLTSSTPMAALNLA